MFVTNLMLPNTINPVLSPPPPQGAYLFQTHLRRGLIETRGLFERGRGRGGLFNLAKTVVSVLRKALEYKVVKLRYKKSEVMQLRIKNKSELPVGE